jgi:hypothetical protein
MAFLMKTSETNKFLKIFCKPFLIVKKYFASTRTYFHFYKKVFFNSQAVRIRVKAATNRNPSVCNDWRAG